MIVEERQERFHRAVAKIKSMSNTTTIPSYREVVDKLEELEKENALLGRRYDELTKLIRKQGKDNVYLEKACNEARGEEWDYDRMNIIGQNGNDGLHYTV